MNERSFSLRTLTVALRDIRQIRRTAGIKVVLSFLLAVCRSLPAVLSTRSLSPADTAMPSRSYLFTPFTGRPPIILDSRTEPGRGDVFRGAREMYCRRVYFPDARFSITPGDTVVDLGANIGLFTTMAAVLGASVLAVEAQSGFLPFMENILARNGVAAQASIHLALLGGYSGVLRDGSAAASHWGTQPQSITLGHLLRNERVSRIDFLKIDIEGSEFPLFEEDVEWLQSTERIAMEVHPAFGNPRTLVTRIESSGLTTWLTDNSGRRVDQVRDSTGFLYAVRVPQSARSG